MCSEWNYTRTKHPKHYLVYLLCILLTLNYVSTNLSGYMMAVVGNSIMVSQCHLKGGRFTMTQTQVRYWELQEDKRHNRATEKLGTDTLSENVRHNRVTESQTATSLKETKRHNIVNEKLTASQIAESIRHNKAAESETRRHNVVTEALGTIDTQTRQYNAETGRMSQQSQAAVNETVAALNKVTEDTRFIEALSKTGEAGKAAAFTYALETYISNPNVGGDLKAAAKQALSGMHTIQKIREQEIATGRELVDASTKNRWVATIKKCLSKMGAAFMPGDSNAYETAFNIFWATSGPSKANK